MQERHVVINVPCGGEARVDLLRLGQTCSAVRRIATSSTFMFHVQRADLATHPDHQASRRISELTLEGVGLHSRPVFELELFLMKRNC